MLGSKSSKPSWEGEQIKPWTLLWPPASWEIKNQADGDEKVPQPNVVLCLRHAGAPSRLSCSHTPNHTDVPGYREHKYEERCFLRHSVQSYQLRRREDAPGAEHGHSDMPARNPKWK